MYIWAFSGISILFQQKASLFMHDTALSCAQLLSCVGLFVTPWTIALRTPLTSPDLVGRFFTTEPSGKPMHNTALCWSTDNSFPALAISWMSPGKSSGLAGLSLSVLYHIWSPCKACPTTHYSRAFCDLCLEAPDTFQLTFQITCTVTLLYVFPLVNVFSS